MYKSGDIATVRLDDVDAKLLNGELQSFRVGRSQIIAHTSYKAFVYKINDGDFSEEYVSISQAEYAAEEEIEKYEIERAEVSIYMCIKAYETGRTTGPSDNEHSIMDKRSLGVK